MLSKDLFATGLRKIASAKGIKSELGVDRIQVYYDRLRHIPAEAWDDIVDSSIDRSKGFPTPGELADLFGNWLAAHPDKASSREEESTKCPFCHNKGFYDVLYIPTFVRQWAYLNRPDMATSDLWKNKRFIYQGVVNCGNCRTRKFGKPVAMTYQDLLESKYIRLKPESLLPDEPVSDHPDIEELAEQSTMEF
jgi:hypothetical protein